MAARYLFSGLDHRRPDDWRAAVYEVTGLQMLSGSGRMAVAAGREPGNLADLGLFRRQPARLRADAAVADVRRLLRRRGPLGTAADAVDRADRRLERGRRAPARDSCHVGKQRQHPGAMAPKGGHRAAGTLSLAYRQFWCWTPPSKPQLAICTFEPRREDRRPNLGSP